MNFLCLLVLAVFPAALIAAGFRDATSFTIPNRLPILLALAFAPAALLAHLPPAVIGLQLAVGAAVLAVGIAMFALRWCGGGDAKLMAAAALWLGWPAVLTFGAWTAVAGGVLGLSLIAMRRGVLAPYAARGPAWVGRLMASDAGLPYGVAIACGAIAALPHSDIARALLGA
jgi:prepilin peptidase CpaA